MLNSRDEAVAFWGGGTDLAAVQTPMKDRTLQTLPCCQSALAGRVRCSPARPQPPPPQGSRAGPAPPAGAPGSGGHRHLGTGTGLWQGLAAPGNVLTALHGLLLRPAPAATQGSSGHLLFGVRLVCIPLLSCAISTFSVTRNDSEHTREHLSDS